MHTRTYSSNGRPIFGFARAAVSMTYDDGMSQHLDHSVPDLESQALRGTFYVPTGGDISSPWHTRAAEWRTLASRGHEIGNHTRLHPCRNWKGNSLEDYTLQQIEDELKLAERELADRVGATARSFAYPCGNTTVGPDSDQVSYVELANSLFPASRVGGDSFADPVAVDFGCVPSFVMLESVSIELAIERLDQAIANQQWIVLMFHGVGGGHLNYGRKEHQALCKAIADRSKELRCGTLVEIALAIREATGRPWNPRSYF